MAKYVRCKIDQLLILTNLLFIKLYQDDISIGSRLHPLV